MDEPKIAEFDIYDRNYVEAVNRALAFSGMKIDYFTRIKVDYFLELIESVQSSAKRAEIIDIGCGVANSHPLFAGRIARLAGVDVSEACIRQAAARNTQNEYRFYDGCNIPYPNASFDAASAVCVFHHVSVSQRLRLAQDVRRVLRSGGLFALFEHNPLNPLTRLVVNNCEFDKDAVLLKKGEAEDLLKCAGFRDVQTRFILTIPAKGKVLHAIDRLFAWVPLGAQYLSFGRS